MTIVWLPGCPRMTPKGQAADVIKLPDLAKHCLDKSQVIKMILLLILIIIIIII